MVISCCSVTGVIPYELLLKAQLTTIAKINVDVTFRRGAIVESCSMNELHEKTYIRQEEALCDEFMRRRVLAEVKCQWGLARKLMHRTEVRGSGHVLWHEICFNENNALQGKKPM